MSESLPESQFPATYESVPVLIRAVRWDGTAAHATDLIDWMTQSGARSGYRCDDDSAPCPDDEAKHHIAVETLEGTMPLRKGSWLICGTEGEFYPCKDSVFRRKYKNAEPARG